MGHRVIEGSSPNGDGAAEKLIRPHRRNQSMGAPNDAGVFAEAPNVASEASRLTGRGASYQMGRDRGRESTGDGDIGSEKDVLQYGSIWSTPAPLIQRRSAVTRSWGGKSSLTATTPPSSHGGVRRHYPHTTR